MWTDRKQFPGTPIEKLREKVNAYMVRRDAHYTFSFRMHRHSKDKRCIVRRILANKSYKSLRVWTYKSHILNQQRNPSDAEL